MMWGWEGLYGRPRGGVGSCSPRCKLSSRHIWNKGDYKSPHPTSAPPLPLQRTSLGRRFTRSHCKGGSGVDVGWGPSRSPWWFLLRRSSSILMSFRDTPFITHEEKVLRLPPRISSRLPLYLECTSAVTRSIYLSLLLGGTPCQIQNEIGYKKRMRTGNPGTAGDPISANGNGEPSAKITRPTGRPGISSRMISPAPTPIAGAKMDCWGSATIRACSVLPWLCGTRPTPS